MSSASAPRNSARSDFYVVALIALGVVVIHILTNGRYGFHRDELQVLDDARHPAWGYVTYPPLNPFIERISLALFGFSLVGLRLFSALAQGAVLILTGLMTRELGGERLAQIVAVCAVAISPAQLFWGTEFQYGSFDYLFWVLLAFCAVRLLQSDDPRWWLGIGASIGLGMMTKYTMGFFVAGLVGAVLVTPARRFLKSRWLWLGAALGVLIFLPNLIWQFHHDFVSLHFLQHIHARDVGTGRTHGFFKDQFVISTNLFAAPLWIAGLYYFFAAADAKRFRLLGWTYAVTFAIFFFAKGRGYYLAPAYPMLFAGGAVLGERWIASLSISASRWARGVAFGALAIGAVCAGAFILPIAPVNSPRNIALKLNGDLREEVGWPELVRSIADIRDSLPADERNGLGILAANYGEAGALQLYGPAYGLPRVMSGVNSFWERGYSNPAPQTLIVVGFDFEFMQSTFDSCELAGHNGNPYGLKNEESSEHPNIYLCRGLRKSWPEFWKDFQYFG
ncbi:MAG: glycosyltransferase family 39 protein [Candidatus Acidiferrales bacterium]